MPKTKLEKYLGVKRSDWKKRWPINCRLEWQGKILYYKWVKWKPIDLSKTQAWEVGPEWKTKSIKVVKKTTVRSIFLTLPGKGNRTVKWEFAIPEKDFFTWLYWLMVSIQKHGGTPISDERLQGLGMKDTRKGKIRSLRGTNVFEKEHPVFIDAVAIYEKGGRLSPRRKDGLLTGDSGDEYKIHSSKKGKGGWGLVLGSERMKWKMVGPHKPIVVKCAPMANLTGGGGEKRVAHDQGTALIREGLILSAIGLHPNIVKMFDAVATDRCAYVFLEKGEWDLKHVKQEYLNPMRILDISIGMLSGLVHMHGRRIFHLDIKPDNVMVFMDGTTKLIDFGMGICRSIDSKEYVKRKGTPGTPDFGATDGYMPPETWTKMPTKGAEIARHFEMRDCYAAGMTILDGLICPFYGMKKYKAKWGQGRVKEVRKLEYWTKEIDKRLKTEADKTMLYICTLARHMIKENPALRLTVQQSLEGFKRVKKSVQKGVQKGVDKGVQVIEIAPIRESPKKKAPTRSRKKYKIQAAEDFLAKIKQYERPKRTSRPAKRIETKHDTISSNSAFKFFEELERKNS